MKWRSGKSRSARDLPDPFGNLRLLVAAADEHQHAKQRHDRESELVRLGDGGEGQHAGVAERRSATIQIRKAGGVERKASDRVTRKTGEDRVGIRSIANQRAERIIVPPLIAKLPLPEILSKEPRLAISKLVLPVVIVKFAIPVRLPIAVEFSVKAPPFTVTLLRRGSFPTPQY